MAKITNITIIDKHTLRLEADARQGDEIHLLDINQVDTSVLIQKIDEATDLEYVKRLQAVRQELQVEKERDLLSATEQLKQETTTLKTQLASKENEIKAVLQASFDKAKADLDHKIGLLEQDKQALIKQKETEIKLAIQQKESAIQAEISTLKQDINMLQRDKQEAVKDAISEKQHELDMLTFKLEQEKKNADLEKQAAVRDIENNLNNIIRDQKEKIDNLQLTKSLMSVKRLGEELESWCNQEYQNHALHGFETCTWEKDTMAVRDEGDTKGTKADYLFRVFATKNKLHSDLLTSVVCEMKSEDPSSAKKQKNEVHFNKLDKDRAKKQCEYALLISELEWETANDAPIRKIPDYEKMYMVRPQYFIVFLGIVTALGMKYKELMLQQRLELEQFKESQDIIDEFEKMKEQILDRSLRLLEKELTSIVENASKINDIATKIFESGNKAIDSYIAQIQNRIENFNITKINKKISKTITQE